MNQVGIFAPTPPGGGTGTGGGDATSEISIHIPDEPLGELITIIDVEMGTIMTPVAPPEAALPSTPAADPALPAPERSVGAPSKTHLLTEEWTWENLRDFVVSGIESRIGSFPRNPVTEKSIFSSFLNRWGDQARPIAEHAVSVCDCWWNNAPLSVNRFCRASDPYFAQPISERFN